MKKIAIGSVLALAAILSIAASGNTCCGGKPDIQRDIVDTYVKLKYGDCCAAGVLLDVAGKRCVLTAAHVYKKADDIEAIKYSPKSDKSVHWSLTKVAVCTIADLGLFSFDDPDGLPPPAHFSGDINYGYGTPIWYVGSPWGEYGILEQSIVAHPRYKFEKRFMVALNGSMWYGNSGGGMFVKGAARYELIGITVHRMNLSERSQGLAENQDTIKKFLDACSKVIKESSCACN